MSPTTAELVLAMNALGTQRKDPVLASMYRHLAHWPPYLALAWAIIAPLDADGRLGRAIGDAAAIHSHDGHVHERHGPRPASGGPKGPARP